LTERRRVDRHQFIRPSIETGNPGMSRSATFPTEMIVQRPGAILFANKLYRRDGVAARRRFMPFRDMTAQSDQVHRNRKCGRLRQMCSLRGLLDNPELTDNEHSTKHQNPTSRALNARKFPSEARELKRQPSLCQPRTRP
jgi:hypothetical protein